MPAIQSTGLLRAQVTPDSARFAAPDSARISAPVIDSLATPQLPADTTRAENQSIDSLGAVDLTAFPDSALTDSALTDSALTDSALADSSIVDRYVTGFSRDQYVASIFPREKSNLSLRLGSYWRHEIEMDSTGTRYVSREMVGGADVRYPVVLDPEAYREARFEYDKERTFRSLVQQRSSRRASGRRGLGLNVVVPGGESSAFTTIFGKPEVDLRVNGQVNIDAGIAYQKSDQRISLTGDEGQLDPDFGQNIRLGITGSIGDKLRIDVNWDTERTFDFQNQLKLEYTGYEDDIVKKVIAGNVFLQTPSSLIQGGQRLFGIRTDLQVGGLSMTTVLSQQEAQSEELAIEGGSQTTEFSLRPTDYDDATHFFQAFYFRNRWEESLAEPPILQLEIDRITDVEVWKLQQTTVEQDNERQVLALVDLAEPSNFTDDPNNPQEVQPDPEIDQYSEDDLDFLRDGANAIETYLNGLGAEAKDFQVGKFQRLERRRDYEIDEFLGTLTLNNRLTENESIAIAFRYVNRNGQVIQVGDFSNDDGGSTGQQNDNRLILKLLKKANQIATDPSWPLTMRNVYKIQGRGFTRDDFELDLFYERAGQPPTRTLPGLTSQGGQLSLLQMTGLDRLNEEEAQIPDNKFDFQPYLIRSGEGLLFFPVLEPFAATIAEFTDDETFIFRNLYTQKQAEARRDSQHDVYRIKGSFRSAVQEVYNLGFFGIVEGSVKVTSGGTNLTEGADYIVDYSTNTVTITNRSFLSAGRDINISYERNQFAAIQKKSLVGVRADYDFLQDVKVGATWMKLSEKPLIDKFRIGEEPLSNSIWGIDGSASSEPRWLTRVIDALPLIQTRAPSSVTLSGEFAQLLPGHPETQAYSRTRDDLQDQGLDFKDDELRGISYIDDFEGVETGITLAQPGAWRLSSPPDSTGAVGPDISGIEGDLLRSQWRAASGWYVLPLNTADFFDFNQNPANFDAVRQIHVNEVYPNRDVSAESGAGLILPTFDMYFDPTQPGPYNWGEELQKFDNPAERTNVWGGMTQRLPEGYNDFDINNVEFVDIIFSPFSQGAGQDAGPDAKLIIDIGSISEDIVPNEKLNTEDGLTLTNLDNSLFDTEGLSRLSSGIQDAVVNVDGVALKTEDMGHDGLPSITGSNPPYEVTEHDWYADFVEAARAHYGESSPTFRRILIDPSSDDFHHFRDEYFDNPALFSDLERSLLQTRYLKFFGSSEANSFEAQRDILGNTPPVVGNTNIPDSEDLNLNATLDTDDRYFQYEIPLSKAELDRLAEPNQINDFVVAKQVGVNPNQPALRSEWYIIKVPVRRYNRRVGGIQDFNLMQSMRIWTTGHTDPITLRFAQLKLVGSQWQKSDEATNAFDVSSALEVATINNEENPNYQIPNGAIRAQTRLPQGGIQEAREQSMLITADDLQAGDQRAVVKPFTRPVDLLKYENLRMFLHGHGEDYTSRDDLKIFVRLGLNEDTDYYEYEQPLTPTDPTSSDPDTVWGTNVQVGDQVIDINSLNIELSRLNQLKIERDDSVAAGVSDVTEIFPKNTEGRAYDFAPPGTQLYVKGNPSLSGVSSIVMGIRVPEENTKVMQTVVVWFNELRASGYDEQAGWAAIGNAQIRLADIGQISANVRSQTDGFGGLSSGLGDRETNSIESLSLTTSWNVHKLMPEGWGWNIPFGFSVRTNRSTPRFSPSRGDIRVEEELAQIDENENLTPLQKDSASVIVTERAQTQSVTRSYSLPVSKRGSKSAVARYTLDATSLNYSYAKTDGSTPSARFNDNWRWNVGLAYRLAIREAKTFKPLFFLRPIPLIGGASNLRMSYVPTSVNLALGAIRSFSENQERSPIALSIGAQTSDSLQYLQTVRFPLRQTHSLTHAQNFGFQYNPFTFLNLGLDSATEQSLRSISVDTLFNVATFDDSLGYRLIENKTLEQAIDEGLILNENNAVELTELQPIPWLDAAKRYFSEGPRTDRSGETYTATFQPRLERIRSLNWLTIQPIAYSSRFQWVNGPAGLNEVGAAVSNNASIRGGVRLAPQELWRKFGWYLALERKQKQLDDQSRIEASREEQEKRQREEAEKRRREAIERGEEPPEGEEGRLPLYDDTTSTGGGFKLPLPSPASILRKTILALTSSRDLSVNLNRTWSGTSAHVKGGHTLLDSWGGEGPSMAYRMGLQRAIPVTPQSRYIENQSLQITDRLQSSTQLGAKTDFQLSQSLQIDFSMDARSDERNDITWRTVNGTALDNTESESGTVQSTVWAFGGSYEEFFSLHMAAFQQDLAASEAAGADFVFDANEDGRTAFENETLVDDFREAFSNSLGSWGAKGFMPFPLPGWTVSYTGLTNWPIFRWISESTSLRHAYSATYDSDYRTNALAGFDEDGLPNVNDVGIAGYTIVYVIPGLEQGSVRINERYQPLFGLDMNLKGGIQTGLTWSKSRSVSLSTGNADVNENSTSDWSLRASFSKRGLRIPLLGKQVQNTVRFTLTFSRTTSVERRFRLKSDFDIFLTDNTDSETFLSPQLIESIRTTTEPRISYAFSSRVSADFFLRYEHLSSQGSRVPTTTNIRSGFNIRVNIAN